MAVNGQSAWRSLGDLTPAQFTAQIKAGSPMLSEADAIYQAVKGYSALYAAHAAHESEWGTTGVATTGGYNALGNKVPGGNNQYMTFDSWAAGAAWWKQHVLDPKGPYAGTTTIAQYVHVYAPSSDGNDEARYVQVICDVANLVSTPAPSSPPASGGTSVGTLTFGNVPFPGFIDHQAATANKPEGVGWDNLGKRTPMFIVLHRMDGTLTSTDNYFPMASTQALTDYGIGTGNVDGAALDGVIYQWNDPYGYRAGWASGPVSAPYGDAVKWLNWKGNKWGYSICNVCGVSMETSGLNQPFTDFAFGELAKWTAYWFDQFKVPYNQAPIRPDTGISAITWHQEWTIGTGKQCPFQWMMDNTQRLIDAAAAIMQPYQTGQIAPAPQPQPAPQPTPQPAPKPRYAQPVPIPELVPYTAKDKDSAAAVVHRGETDFVWVNDTVKVTKDTPRRQYASATSASVGPDLKAGETLDVLWECKAGDGKHYYITGQWSRVSVDDTVRVKD